MKKGLLVLVLLFTFFYSNSQVIDIIGTGVHGKTSATIQLTDISNINHVDAVIASKGLYVSVPETGVLFDNSDTASSTWNPVDIYISPLWDESIGLYSRTFNSLNDPNINASISIPNYVHSFMTYVYRDIPNATFKSFINSESAFVYHNGSDNPVIYDIPINTSTTVRNVTVKIPISELDSGRRMVNIHIEAGDISMDLVENTFNFGNSFFLGEYLLENVPGNVTNVVVSFYSPNPLPPDNEEDGDSFIINSVIVDVDIVDDGCTLTQGYWKTHSNCKAKGPKRDDTWDLILPLAENSLFFNSGKDYCEVFDTQSNKKNGKYYILAHQYIAAELNMLAGANPTDAQVAFNEATILLDTYTPNEVKGNAGLEADCVRLGSILDDYNNGRIGPGHCDDDNQTSTEVEQQKSKIAIYPNPATTHGKIEFTSKQNAKTTVELYNIRGQKVGVLFNEKTKMGIPITIEYNTEQFKRGIYYAVITNGSDMYKEKISILK